MSLNLGNDGINAIRELRANENWHVVRAVMLEQVRRFMNAALEPGSARDDAVGYARALRDVHLAFESATTGEPFQRVEKPAPVGGVNRAAR